MNLLCDEELSFDDESEDVWWCYDQELDCFYPLIEDDDWRVTSDYIEQEQLLCDVFA